MLAVKVSSAPVVLSWPTKMAARVQAIFLPALMSGEDDTEGGVSTIVAYEATRRGRPSNVNDCLGEGQSTITVQTVTMRVQNFNK